MDVIIVGCGRVGSRLASRLAAQGHWVAVIDQEREAFRRLGPEFPGRIVHGSALDGGTLARAGAEHAEMVVSVTGGDNRNLMVAQIAKHRFHVRRVIARLHDPVRSAVYRRMGVETLCTTTVMAGLLEISVNQGDYAALPAEILASGDDSELGD